MSAVSKQQEREFVLLIALMMSLGALSIDAVLPALPSIAADFALLEGNAIQLVIGIVLLGMTFGQLAFGPASDRWGRRPTLLAGVLLFMLGSLLSLFAEEFNLLITGRFLQGLGAAALRIVPLAIVRDRFEGKEMARVMSLAMSVFILVPCIAPLLGQGIQAMFGWRMIFAILSSLSAVTALWIILRQPESLRYDSQEKTNKAKISLYQRVKSVLSDKRTSSCIVAMGLVQGIFTGYILSAEQIFRDIFSVGNMFALYFALGAISIGAGSLVNAKLVTQLGLRETCWFALWSITLVSGVMYPLVLLDALALVSFVTAISIIFFCLGLLIGNLNAIAMQGFGHMAGLANSVISFLSGCIALVCGASIGAAFNTNLLPMITGILIISLLSMFAFRLSSNTHERTDEKSQSNTLTLGEQ